MIKMLLLGGLESMRFFYGKVDVWKLLEMLGGKMGSLYSFSEPPSKEALVMALFGEEETPLELVCTDEHGGEVKLALLVEDFSWSDNARKSFVVCGKLVGASHWYAEAEYWDNDDERGTVKLVESRHLEEEVA